MKTQKEKHFQTQEKLAKIIVAGDFDRFRAYLNKIKAPLTGPTRNSLIRKILNIDDQALIRNHFLILEALIDTQTQFEPSIVRNICRWLININRTHPLLTEEHGQRILACFIQRNYIKNCDLANLKNDDDIHYNEAVHSESLSKEMFQAILNDEPREFEICSSQHFFVLNEEIFMDMLMKCVNAKAFNIITSLLEYPLSSELTKVVECVSILNQHLYSEDTELQDLHREKINATKITFLQFIAMSYALAPNGGKVRTALEDIINQLLEQAGIKTPKEAVVLIRINYLLRELDDNPKQIDIPLAPNNPGFFSKAKLIVSYVKNVHQTREAGKYNRRDFIAKNMMLGMMPGAKCALAIVNAFKEQGMQLGLVVTCLEDFEIRWGNRLYTPASPEYWATLPGNIKQLQVPIQDFGFKADLEILSKTLNAMNAAAKMGLGIYIHCKAGKGRSVFVLALYYVLFSKELQKATLMITIKSVYAFIAESRGQISNHQKSWDAVYKYALLYMESKWKHADVCLNLEKLPISDYSGEESDDSSNDHVDHYTC